MLQADNAALVIVDIQGKLASLMYQKEIFYDNVVRMIKGARLLNIPIIWNEQLPDKLGATIEPIKSELSDLHPLVKKSFSCCGNPDFVKRLKATGRKQVLLTGMETHICVFQTAVDLLDAGYEVHLVTDAVASRFEHNYRVGIERIKDHGAIVTSTEMALFEMFDIAEGPQFKELVKIVK
ncbi:MAG: hydrolase [candidate division Zixibacteria bacterium]|nr:hydrolase [candidate division Zixibacteria bacterium]